MKRINYLVDLINPCHNIIDIGSDHAYLAVGVLKQNKAQLVVNIEINENPLKQGILNLQKAQLLDKTLNFVNDGFNGLEAKLPTKVFDYAVISGMGANSIINIMQNNKLRILTFILQPNNHEEKLRKWLGRHGYKIVSEHFINERHFWYPIFIVKKTYLPKCFQSYEKCFLGHPNHISDLNQYLSFIRYKLAYLEDLNSHAKAKNQRLEKCLRQRIEWIERRIRNAN